VARTANAAKAEIFEVDQLPALKKNDKHSIEVVVDRIKVRPDIQQRLAESFETALRLADGKAMIVDMNTGEEMIFSSKFACPVCSVFPTRIRAASFFFNNPMGACPSCDGLGTNLSLIQNVSLRTRIYPLLQAPLKAGIDCNQFYFKLLQTLAKHGGFDVEKPFESLSKKQQDLILLGSGDVTIPFEYINERGKNTIREHAFEGIVANFERRYRETDSVTVREELARYQNIQTCPECSGSRLRKEACFVRVGEKKQARAIYEISALPLKEAKEYFEALELKGAKKEIADKIVKEISARLRFLNDVGLDYLSLERSADTLSGGEAQRIRLASQIGSGLTGVMYALDEPSIGLHQRDNDRLIGTLKHLRDLGNSVLVVEHDEDSDSRIRLGD
jgi:excinuclease ABC subunit A